MARTKKELPKGMVNDLINVKYAKDVKKGMRIGRWIVVEDGYIVENRVTKIKVRCTCGSEVEKYLAMGDLKKNTSLSCGCYFKENSSKIHKGKTISKEQREQHSQRMMGEGNPMYGKPCSDERKENISKARKGKCTGENHWNYGKHESEETKRKQSEARKGKYTGENSSSWKGGITAIENYLRSLTTQWDRNVRQYYNKQCVLTGVKCTIKNSTVHHLYGFNMIVQDAHDKYNIQVKPQVKDYTSEELKLLENYVAEWHRDTSNGVLLSKEVHYLFHHCKDEDGNVLYGKGSNTPEQFEEFKQRYLNGEFDSKTEDVA